ERQRFDLVDEPARDVSDLLLVEHDLPAAVAVLREIREPVHVAAALDSAASAALVLERVVADRGADLAEIDLGRDLAHERAKVVGELERLTHPRRCQHTTACQRKPSNAPTGGSRVASEYDRID